MSAIARKCLALLLTATLMFSLVGTAVADTRVVAPQAPFLDVYGTRFQEAVNALWGLKVVTGKSENAYEPFADVTRAEMAVLVTRALGVSKPTVAATPFPDVQATHWAAGAVGLASQLGIVTGGTDGFFRPGDPVTYPQAVAMLLRAVGLAEKAGSYPAGYVLLAKDLGLIDGIDWDMNKSAIRGDIALMLYRTVFFVPQISSNKTLSQTVFRRAGAVAILPEATVLSKGQTQFSASVVDWVGKELEPAVAWAAEGATIDQKGILTVTGDGPVTVKATVGEASTSKTYNVITGLKVEADSTAVAAGGTVTLRASGTTGTGATVAAAPKWEIRSGNGTVTKDGVVTVQGPAAVTVRASVGTVTADTKIFVVGSVTVSPDSVVASNNQDVQFTAKVFDPSGTEISVPVTWSATGAGSIDQQGKYRAAGGTATVTAKVGTIQGTATVKTLGRIEVSPATAQLRKGETKKFTATVYGPNNETLNAPVQWTVEPTSLGFFSAGGDFFAANAGSGAIIATYGSTTVRVPVTVGGQAASLRMSATPTAATANGTTTVQIKAELVDAAGNSATGAESVFFSLSSTNMGRLDRTQARFENGVATATLTVGTVSGSYSVYASVPGSSIPTQTMSLNLSAPSISHIAIEAYPNPMAADGLSQTTITARLMDATGAAIANYTSGPIIVNLNSSNGTTGRLGSNMVQISVGQKSATTTFHAGNTPGTTVISGSSVYSVQPATLSTQVVGAAYRLKLRTGTPATAPADNSTEIPVYVEIQDLNGNVRTGDNGSVVSLSAISGPTTLTIPSQTVQWGVATFRLKAVKAGTYALNTWAITANNLQGDRGEVTFTAGTPYKVALEADPSTSLAADNRSVANLRAKIQDISGNTIPTATHQVRFLRTAGSQNVTTLPSNLTVNAVNGEAVLQVTAGNQVGTDVFYAEADGLMTSGQVAIRTRITGVPVKVSVRPLTDTTIGAGASTTVTVWVLDQQDLLATADNGRLVYLNASNGATVSGPAPTVNGVATFTVSSTKSGGNLITASADGLTPDLTGRTLTIAQSVPDHIVLEASPESLSADGVSRSNITAKLVDRYGNPAVGSFAVSLNMSTGNYLNLISSSIYTGGQTQVVSKTTTGSTTITGTNATYPVTPVTVTTYVPGRPTRVVMDRLAPVEAGTAFANQAVVKARILDENGNLLTNMNTNHELTAMALRITSSSGGTATTLVTMFNTQGLGAYALYPNGTTLGAAAVTNGIAQWTVTNTRAETVTLTPIVYYKGVALPVQDGSLTTTAGPAARLNVTASASGASTAVATDIVVTASIADVYGNPVNAGQDTITFSTGNSALISLPSQRSVDTATGSASITVTTKPQTSGGTTSVSAISKRFGFSGVVSITADLPPEKPQLTVLDNAGIDTVVSGADTGLRIFVSVPRRITDQTVTLYVNGAQVPMYSEVTFTNQVSSIPAGQTLSIVYVKKGDLGGAGVKDVRAMIHTPLGVSPLSDGAMITVQ